MLKKFFNPKSIIFTVLIILLLIFAPKIINLLMLLFASFVLAAALNPYVNKLHDKIKNRAIAATTIVISSIVALFALILPIIIICYKEVVLFISLLPQKALNLYTFITQSKLYGYSIKELLPMEQISEATSNLAQNVVNQSVNLTMGVMQMLIVTLALTMFIYYILVDKQYLKSKFIEFFPPNIKEKADNIIYTITNKVGNYVRAQIISMIAVGIMITVICAILGIDYPILLGLISGILDIIPLVGPTVALCIIIAVAFPLGAVKVILAIILFLVAQNISNYVIRPFLFGKFMKLHPITILVSLFVAQEFLGLWGVILAPAIAATICVLIDELYLRPINEKELETEIE